MPEFNTAYPTHSTERLQWHGVEAEDAESTAAAVDSSEQGALLPDTRPTPDAGAVLRHPVFSRGVLTGERAVRDVKEAGQAQADIVRTMESNIQRIAKRRPAADLAPVQAMATLTDAKMRNALNAFEKVVAGAQVLPGIEAAVSEKLKGPRQELAAMFRAPTPGNAFAAPAAPAPPVGDSMQAFFGDSMQAFFGDISQAIDGLKENYLGVYEQGMQKNSAFYKEFLDATDLSKWMRTNDKNVILELVAPGTPLPDLTEAELTVLVDKGMAEGVGRYIDGATGSPVWVKYTRAAYQDHVLQEHKAKQDEQAASSGLLGGLQQLLKKFEPRTSTDEGIFVKAKDEESAKKWAKDMGLAETVVMPSKDHPPQPGEEWWVTLDLGPVRKIVKGLNDPEKGLIKKYNAKLDAQGKITVTMPTAEFQAWKVGYEAQATEIKNTATGMAQKMANAQSIYENLIKVLTNTINSIMDMLKNFL
ncbi:MAG TPA: IpaD/SipD/SspD family type III secretion system needle tip protein [Herbaspirillum sp.]